MFPSSFLICKSKFGSYAVTNSEHFTRNLVFGLDNCFSFVEFYINMSAFNSLNSAIKNLTDLGIRPCL